MPLPVYHGNHFILQHRNNHDSRFVITVAGNVNTCIPYADRNDCKTIMKKEFTTRHLLDVFEKKLTQNNCSPADFEQLGQAILEIFKL